MKRVHRSKGMIAVLCGALSLSILAPACGDDDGTDGVDGGAAGEAGAGPKAGTGGAKGGTGGTGNGEGGEPAGGAPNGTGGTTAGTGGTSGNTGEGGSGGAPEGGTGGVPEGGTGGVGEGGTGGVPEGGTGGVEEGGAGGEGGGGPVFTNCLDGCASLYTPFSDDSTQQYFQITFAGGGADLSGSIVSFKIRARDYTGTAGYVNTTAYDGANFFGSSGTNAKGLTAISDWTVITLDLTNVDPPFDATSVDNISLQLGGTDVPVTLEVDEVTFSDGALDPFLFETDGSPFEIGFNPVAGSLVEWQGPY